MASYDQICTVMCCKKLVGQTYNHWSKHMGEEEGRDYEIVGESSLVVGARDAADPGKCPDLRRCWCEVCFPVRC